MNIRRGYPLLYSSLSLSLLLAGLTCPPVIQAALPALSINATNPANGANGLPVDVVASGMTFSHMLVNGSSSQLYCWPVISTITEQTVKLSETHNSSISHPFYTASWNRPAVVPTPSPTTISQGSFILRNVQPGYQLRAHTDYTVWLKGGSQGIRFVCSDGQFTYLSNANNYYQFTTGADTIAPTIINPTAAASLNNAQVQWSTAELTTGKVEYGKTTAYGKTVSSSTAKQDHNLALADLQPGTTYYYRITSTDTATNPNSSQVSGTFQTWSMGAVQVSDVTGHEASISWHTTVATDSIVEYGTSSNLGLRSGGKDMLQQHQIRLSHLQSNTTYFFRIKATNDNGVAVTQQLRFATRDALAGPSPDVITFDPEVIGISDEWSRFNLKDFPLDEQASVSAEQASPGAVLSASDDQNNPLTQASATAGRLVEQHGWWLWYIIPLLLLIGLIVAVYVYLRHDLRMNKWRLDLKKSKSSP